MADFTIDFSINEETYVLHDTSAERAEEAAARAEAALEEIESATITPIVSDGNITFELLGGD